MIKPVIGLTVYYEDRGERVYSCVSNNYINAVIRAGGVPMLIPINEEDLESYLDMVDGIMLTGGDDVAPELYGEKPIPELGDVSYERDSFEIALFKRAYALNKPILGICRGLQVINVALGGSLYQDIYAQIKNVKLHNPKKPRNELQHKVTIDKTSRLYEILHNEEIETNSFHHQAVKVLAEGLKITAKSEEGIIEAFESETNPRLLAVQWHPEDLVNKYPHFLELFKQILVG